MCDDTQQILLCCDSSVNIYNLSVSRAKLQSSSLFYRALTTSGMYDANQTKLVVPDVTANGLLSIVNYIEQRGNWNVDSHLLKEPLCGIIIQNSSMMEFGTMMKHSGCFRKENKFLQHVVSLQLLFCLGTANMFKTYAEELNISAKVVAAACYLQMNDLLNDCSKILISNLSPDTWLDTLLLSHRYCLTAVRTAIYKYIVKHFCRRPKLLSRSALSKLTVEDICSIVDDDDISAKEKAIFDVAYSWLRYCSGEKAYKTAATVLNLIRFPLMSSGDLKICSDKMSSLSVPTESYSHLLEEAERYAADPKNCSFDERRVQARCLINVVVASGGFTATEHSSNRMQLLQLEDFISYAEKSHENSDKPVGFRQCQSTRLPHPLCEHASCLVGNVLYIAGGQKRYNCDGRHTAREVYSFDSRLCTWNVLKNRLYIDKLRSVEYVDGNGDSVFFVRQSQMNLMQQCSPMNVPRSLFFLAELNDQIYAVAGWTAVNEDTSTVERYSPKTDQWQKMSDFPTDVHEHAGCKRDGKLYVSGGFRGPFHGHIDKFYCYTAELDRWDELAPLHIARSYHVMASTRCHIAAIGGVHYDNDSDAFDDLQSCEIYDPTVDQWTVIIDKCLPFHTSCAPSVVFENEGDVNVAILGGHSFANDSDHSSLQVVHFGGAVESSDSLPRRSDAECVATCAFNSHGVQYCALNVMKLPAQYVGRFH